MDGSVITAQEAHTEKNPCRLQFPCAVIMFSTDKTAMRNIAAAAPALDQVDPEAPGRARGKCSAHTSSSGIIYIIDLYKYIYVYLYLDYCF